MENGGVAFAAGVLHSLCSPAFRNLADGREQVSCIGGLCGSVVGHAGGGGLRASGPVSCVVSGRTVDGGQGLSTLLLCVLITLGNWCYTAGVFGLELNLRLLAVCLLWMVVIGPFPIVLFVMWNRNLQLSHNLQEAVAMNARLAERVQAEVVSEPRSAEAREEVLLEGGTKESLALDPVRLLYAESEGNYVRLHYLDADSGKPAVKLLRLTLKQAEDAFLDYSYIIRCHRAYLVNLHRVAQVSGNAQGYRLHLEEYGTEIPVSRSYAVRVKRALEGSE